LLTAKLYLQLGTAEQQAHQYAAAINSFFQAAAIYRHVSRQAALATALDHAAVAYCQAHQEGATTPIHRQHKVSRFYRCLYEALQLRKQELGPWHADTVDSLQHLAQLCLATGHAARAAGHYLEVVYLRKAIFGPHHPGTAVTAHCLGNAYLQSHDTVAAELWYDHALAVYNHMQLPNDNPAVAKLLRDRKRLERVDRWMEEDPADDENLLFEL
jgi:tetratricopeptide (TPR) repeat protein